MKKNTRRQFIGGLIGGSLGTVAAAPASQADEKQAKLPAVVQTVAIRYLEAVKNGDSEGYRRLFAAEGKLLSSSVWEKIIIPSASAGRQYQALLADYMRDLPELAKRLPQLKDFDVRAARITLAGSLTTDHVEGLAIFVPANNDQQIDNLVVTGPLIKDAADWRFAGRARAPGI